MRGGGAAICQPGAGLPAPEGLVSRLELRVCGLMAMAMGWRGRNGGSSRGGLRIVHGSFLLAFFEFRG